MPPCDYQYVAVEVRDPLDVLNDQRDEALATIEQELAAGTARIETDALGQTSVVGASVTPQGMSDLCVLDALQSRNSLEWQLAAQHAGVQNQNFVTAHAAAHAARGAAGRKH